MRTRGTLMAFLALVAPAVAQDVGARDGSDRDAHDRGRDRAGMEASHPASLPDLTNAQAVAPLKDIQGALKACFKAELRSNPDMPAHVVLSFVITEEGTPIDVQLDPLALRGRPVVGCVQEAVATLRWPRFSAERKRVSMPFNFSSPSIPDPTPAPAPPAPQPWGCAWPW